MNICELGDLIIIGPSNGIYKSESFIGSGTLLLDIKSLYQGFTASLSEARRVQLNESERKKYQLLSGDILINRVSKKPEGVGKTVLVSDLQEPAVYESNMMRFRVDTKKVIPWYIVYYLASESSRKELLSKANISNQASINQETVKSLKIPLLPLVEQKRIAAILGKCDRLRRTRRYALQLSNTFLQSVFLEMFGNFLHLNTENQFQEVLEIPLSNGVFEKNENYGSGTPVIWVDNLYHTTSIDTSKLRRANLDNKSIQKYEVFEGDLLFTRSSLVREGTGQINIVPKLSERTTFECHTIRARVNKKLVNPYYILGLYRSSYGRNLIMQRANTATMTTIGQEGIEELLCPIPPLPLQEKFARIVQKFERLRTQQREAERQAEHLFQTLLHRAFRGDLTSSDFNDETVSVFSQEIPVQQPKPKYPSEIAEYLRTKVNQQETEAVQLTLPGLE